MLPVAVIEHQAPGRVRLRVPSKRGDQAFFDAVAEGLAGHPLVDGLRTDPRLGSVIVTHREGAEAILAAAAERGAFQIGGRPAAASGREPRPTRAELLELAATIFSLLGLLQLRRQPMGPATEHCWNAFGARRTLQSGGLTADFAVLGLIQLLRARVAGSATTLFFDALVSHRLAQSERSRSAAGPAQ